MQAFSNRLPPPVGIFQRTGDQQPEFYHIPPGGLQDCVVFLARQEPRLAQKPPFFKMGQKNLFAFLRLRAQVLL
jgi:hypothetical protein